ncbi:hypothetical protein YC2023_018504 [Brassica napus]
MVTPIETSRELVQSDNERGSYRDGEKAGWRKASTKSRHDRSIADGSSLQYDNFTPKVEFLEHSVDPEEAKAYREAKGEVKPPTPGTQGKQRFSSIAQMRPLRPGCRNGIGKLDVGLLARPVSIAVPADGAG